MSIFDKKNALDDLRYQLNKKDLVEAVNEYEIHLSSLPSYDSLIERNPDLQFVVKQNDLERVINEYWKG